MNMAASMFTRFGNLRNLVNVNNVSTLGTVLSISPRLTTTSRYYTTFKDESLTNLESVFETKEKPKKKMSKAMKVYLQRAQDHEEFMNKEIAEYEIGKRHLANIMGEDPENFTQADINRSIEYLFPSGIYDWRARPMMLHPDEIYPIRKAAEFDETGRPFHFLFYTCKSNYYECLYDIVDTLQTLNQIEDKRLAAGKLPSPEDKMNPTGTTWLTRADLEKLLLENITESEYENFVVAIENLLNHPFSAKANDLLTKYRKKLTSLSTEMQLPPFEYDNNGRPFITVKNCMRKSARGEVTVRGNGSGNITINGQDIMYFDNVQCREQLSDAKASVPRKTGNPKQDLNYKLQDTLKKGLYFYDVRRAARRKV